MKKFTLSVIACFVFVFALLLIAGDALAAGGRCANGMCGIAQGTTRVAKAVAAAPQALGAFTPVGGSCCAGGACGSNGGWGRGGRRGNRAVRNSRSGCTNCGCQ